MDGIHPATSQMNCGAASDALKVRAATQCGFNRLEKWANRNLMVFKNGVC